MIAVPIEIVRVVILRHANLSITQRYLRKVSFLGFVNTGFLSIGHAVCFEI